METTAALCASASELRTAAPNSSGKLGDGCGEQELASVVFEGDIAPGLRDEVELATGCEGAKLCKDFGSFRPKTPADAHFPEELHSFRDRLRQAAPIESVSSTVDWSRLVAVETTEALNEALDAPEPESLLHPPASGFGSARGSRPRAVSIEVNSGGQVFFGLLSPRSGELKEEAVVIKFCNSRHMLQSEQMAAELAWHLEVAAPSSRLLLKVHDTSEWDALSLASAALNENLHQTLSRKQSMLVLQFVPGANLRSESDAWQGVQLSSSSNAMGRLLVLDMLLGNADRLPIQSLSWRGNPSNVLWRTPSCASSSCNDRCVPIDAVVARRPPRLLVQDGDQKVASVLELALLDRKSAQQVLLEAVSCNRAAVAAVTADWADNEAAWSKKQDSTPSGDRPPHSAVKAFHEGIRSALALAVRELGLFEMIVGVVRSWLDTFHADMAEVSSAAANALNLTKQIHDFSREANQNNAVKDRLSSWQALLQEKSCALREAANGWATRRNVITAMSFKGFLGDTVLNPVADAYELLVRLQHLIARAKVIANAGNVTRPSDLSPSPLFVGPATSCCFHLLRKLGVSGILNCTTDLPPPPPEVLGSIQWHRISLEDVEDQDMTAGLNEGLAGIDNIVQGGGRVLLHCHEGKSRSVSLCLAYMVTRERRTLADALAFVKTKRSVARPNAGFLKQLIALELATLGANSLSLDELPKGKPKLTSMQKA